MTENNQLPDSVRNRVSRRTVVKAAAWSVPAVVVATASPAAAAVSGTIVISNASGSGSINVIGLATTQFAVTFGGTTNTPHPVTLTVSPIGFQVGVIGNGSFGNYNGNTGNVKPGDTINFTADVQAVLAISPTVVVTATFSDGNPQSSAPVVLGISLNVDLGLNKNATNDAQKQQLQQQSSAPDKAPTPEPTTSEPTVAPTTDSGSSAAPATTTP